MALTKSRAGGRIGAMVAIAGIGIGVLVVAGLPLDGGGSDVPVDPEAVRERWFTEERIEWLLEPVRNELDAGSFPGAAVAFGVGDQEWHQLGLGAIGWTRNAASVEPDSTIYDLASLTKVLATASAIMLLVDDGVISLDDPVSNFLPDFSEGAKAEVTIRHLLTHTSGLPAGAVLRQGADRAERIARAAEFSIYPPAGARVEYSDIGFVLAWEIAEIAAGEPLTNFLDRRLYEPLGMRSTGFLPGLDCERCAPTGRLRDQSLYRGKPFDPLAQRLEGISGNAGLFSTAHDLGRFAAMITSGGTLERARVFSSESLREFTGPQPVGGQYRLGWETMCDVDSAEDEVCAAPLGIGHTGWTGTSLWIDFESGVWTVILTNRTYEPRAPNRLQEVRREVFARATGRARPSPSPMSAASVPDPDTVLVP